MRDVNQAVSAQDEASLLAGLRLPALALLGVQDANSHWYMEHFSNYSQHKAKVWGNWAPTGGLVIIITRDGT